MAVLWMVGGVLPGCSHTPTAGDADLPASSAADLSAVLPPETASVVKVHPNRLQSVLESRHGRAVAGRFIESGAEGHLFSGALRRLFGERWKLESPPPGEPNEWRMSLDHLDRSRYLYAAVSSAGSETYLHAVRRGAAVTDPEVPPRGLPVRLLLPSSSPSELAGELRGYCDDERRRPSVCVAVSRLEPREQYLVVDLWLGGHAHQRAERRDFLERALASAEGQPLLERNSAALRAFAAHEGAVGAVAGFDDIYDLLALTTRVYDHEYGPSHGGESRFARLTGPAVSIMSGLGWRNVEGAEAETLAVLLSARRQEEATPLLFDVVSTHTDQGWAVEQAARRSATVPQIHLSDPVLALDSSWNVAAAFETSVPPGWADNPTDFKPSRPRGFAETANSMFNPLFFTDPSLRSMFRQRADPWPPPDVGLEVLYRTATLLEAPAGIWSTGLDGRDTRQRYWLAKRLERQRNNAYMDVPEPEPRIFPVKRGMSPRAVRLHTAVDSSATDEKGRKRRFQLAFYAEWPSDVWSRDDLQYHLDRIRKDFAEDGYRAHARLQKLEGDASHDPGWAVRFSVNLGLDEAFGEETRLDRSVELAWRPGHRPDDDAAVLSRRYVLFRDFLPNTRSLYVSRAADDSHRIFRIQLGGDSHRPPELVSPPPGTEAFDRSGSGPRTASYHQQTIRELAPHRYWTSSHADDDVYVEPFPDLFDRLTERLETYRRGARVFTDEFRDILASWHLWAGLWARHFDIRIPHRRQFYERQKREAAQKHLDKSCDYGRQRACSLLDAGDGDEDPERD